MLPLRNPSRSSDTYLKPSDLRCSTTCAAKLGVGELRQLLGGNLDPRHVALVIADPQAAESRGPAGIARPASIIASRSGVTCSP